jgi:hypothetical protein
MVAIKRLTNGGLRQVFSDVATNKPGEIKVRVHGYDDALQLHETVFGSA